jgi:extracellular elastinolytic metalloproteinase
MRRFITAAFIAAALVGARHTHDVSGRTRKSLGFGPSLPQAVYETELLHTSLLNEDADPYVVARTFLDGLLRGKLSSASEYKIREDSYTDTNTGVTHIYARQLLHGVEVVGGLINLNIKDGVVLSYGDSVSLASIAPGVQDGY